MLIRHRHRTLTLTRPLGRLLAMALTLTRPLGRLLTMAMA